MAKETILSVMDDVCGHLTIDRKLARAVGAFRLSFMNKNEDHTTFFGGHTIGVQRVRFAPRDEREWLEDIIGATREELESRLWALDTVNPDFKVTGNVINLSFIWLIHAFYRSTLPKKEKEQAMLDVCLVMHYRYLTSLLSEYFRFPANPEYAEATYQLLSYKYLIKQMSSWQEVLEYRSNEVLRVGNKHYPTVQKMNDDNKVNYFLSDSQGAIRGMIKSIYSVFMEVYRSGGRIASTSSIVSFDGEESIRSNTTSIKRYTDYIDSVVSERNGFIKQELLDVIESTVPRCPPHLLKTSLEYISANYGATNKAGNQVNELVKVTVLHCLDYITKNKGIIKNPNDLITILSKIRGVYMASKVSDTVLLGMRESAEDIVRKATKYTNKTIIPTVRTAVLLYIVLRTLTMNHYS